MMAVGNDLVDLRDPESDPTTLHPRFDARVFDPAERDALSCASDATRLRWRLWAAKESAYKAARRLSRDAVFSPARFVTTQGLRDGRDCGFVDHPSGRARVELTECDGAIHAVALQDGAAADPTARGGQELDVLAEVRRLDPADPRCRDPYGPSCAVRELSCERIAEAIGVEPARLCVGRDGRLPTLWLDGAPAFDLSLSHHGTVVAFACRLRQLAGRVADRTLEHCA